MLYGTNNNPINQQGLATTREFNIFGNSSTIF